MGRAEGVVVVGAPAWRPRPMVVLAVGLVVGWSGLPLASATAAGRVADGGPLAAVPAPVVLEPVMPRDVYFGISMSLDDDTLVVNAWDKGRPSARVYVAAGDTWVLQDTLLPRRNGATELDYSVAVDGDTAILGAKGTDVRGVPDAGAAYVFVRSGSTWTQQAKLVPSVLEAQGWAGYNVALQGDTAVVGIPQAGEEPDGAVAIFTRSGSTWTEQAVLRPPEDPLRPGLFGAELALDGDTLVVSTTEWLNEWDPETNRAYVYVGSGASWSLQAQLTGRPPQPELHSSFGHQVAVDGDTIVVTAPNEDDVERDIREAGAAYVFERRGSSWNQTARVTASAPIPWERMGYGMALDGDDLALGAPMDYAVHIGNVYLFHRRADGTWRQTKTLPSPVQNIDEKYGWSLDLDGADTGKATLAVNAPALYRGQQDSAVYIYRQRPSD